MQSSAKNNTVENTIVEKLQHLQPVVLQVLNESHKHNVPEGSETHFNITLVSDQFQDKTRLVRHRIINELLAEQLQNQVHALSLHLFTADEWFEKAQPVAETPPCMGGGR